MKLFSIITVNYNNFSGLRKTMDSVFCQLYVNFEFIIIDGGSSDESKMYINNNSKKIDYWVSEPDGGIYNAMNKGIKQASGKYLFFLNSGDTFLNRQSLSVFAQQNDDKDIIYGDIQIDYNGTTEIKRCPDNLTFDFFRKNTLPHQSTIIKKSLFDLVGLYEEEFKLVADWAFFLKALVFYSASYKHVNQVVCLYDGTGMSSQASNAEKLVVEKEKVLLRHYSFFEIDYRSFEPKIRKFHLYSQSTLHKTVENIKKIFFNKKNYIE